MIDDRPKEGARPDPAPPVVPEENAEELYEHAPCGYMSTLPDGSIIKVNTTLLSWTGHRRDDLLGGRRFVDLLTAGGRIYHETHYAPMLAMQGKVRELALDLVCADGSRLPVLLNALLVREDDGSPRVIRVSMLDATERRTYERELLRARREAERAEARARELARTLQAGLIPPAPPSIPGLDVAAAYRPAGAGDEVGGDFYDVFQVGVDDWAVVLGDVCGKGAAAATITMLARHTMRAAAMRTPTPSRVLAALNAELLTDPSERFATVLYMRLRREGGAGGVTVTICSGGHALPVVLDADGLRHVGRPGTLLGVVAQPDLHDEQLTLHPGAALFGYTDGLTEGRRDDEFFGERRLHAALMALRGRPPGDIPRAVVDEVVDFQRGLPRDDMAAVIVEVPPAEPPTWSPASDDGHVAADSTTPVASSW